VFFLLAVLLYDDSYTIPCHGLVSEWHVKPYWENDRGCAAGTTDYPGGCLVDFNVWTNIDPAPPVTAASFPMTVTLVGTNAAQTGFFLKILVIYVYTLVYF
jgi:hypothetical protein